MDKSIRNTPNIPKGENIIEKLEKSLKAFSDLTDVPITVYDPKGNIISEFRSEDKLCSNLSVYSLRNSGCRKLISFAGEFSSNLGEPYIFLCKAGFSNISVPIIISGEFKGFAVAGPFIMKKLRSSTVKSMLNMNRLDENEQALIRTFIDGMKIFNSNEITDLGVLLFNSILAPILKSSDYSNLNKQNQEQRTISSKIRAAKNAALLDSGFSRETEEKLVEDIMKGDIKGADTIIRNILDSFSIIAVGNLDEIKTMSLWATATVVKSLSNEFSVSFDETLDIDIINKITEAESVEDLAIAFMYIVEHISSGLLSSVYMGSSQLVSSGLKYMKDHYAEKISLNSMCSELHVNPTYFSHLFKEEMGLSFVDHLTDLRLKKAKDLLSSTSLSILDISISTGFENQSYFTKVFKSKEGMTPRQFRLK